MSSEDAEKPDEVEFVADPEVEREEQAEGTDNELQDPPIVQAEDEEGEVAVSASLDLEAPPRSVALQLVNGGKKKRAVIGKRVFATRSRPSHENYKQLLITLEKTKWMRVRFVGRPSDRFISPRDLFIPNESILRELDSWLMDKEVHFNKAMFRMLYNVLKDSEFSVLNSLSAECQQILQGVQDKGLEQWLLRVKPATHNTWKTRLFAKFPTEKQKLTILFSDDLGELHKRINVGVQAFIVCQKILALSKTHIIPGVEIVGPLAETKELAFTGYISGPDTFDLAHEFAETVLQNQLCLRYGSGASEATPTLPCPLDIIVSNLGVMDQAVTAMKNLTGELHMNFDIYSRCKLKMLDEIVAAPEGDHSTHTTVRGWIQSHMSAEYRIAHPTLKAFCPLTTRVVNAIGVHFRIPVVGKHPLRIRILKELPLTGKRSPNPKPVSNLSVDEIEAKIKRTLNNLNTLEQKLKHIRGEDQQAPADPESEVDE